jgi:putative restriction endonuclease
MDIEVSRKIREEFENGRNYYRYSGSMIHIPADTAYHPSPEYLEWHNINVYRG